MRQSSLIHNATALFVIQVANQLLPLITIPYLTRTLGIDAYGAYAFALAIVTVACVVTDFGFTLWATAEVATHCGNTERINQLYGSVTVAKVILLIFTLLAIFIYAINAESLADYRSVFYWSALPIIGLTFQPIWLFNGIERMAQITIFVLLSRLVFITLTFMLVTTADDLALLMGINGLTQIITAILCFAMLLRLGYVPTRPKIVACREVLKQASPFFLSRVAVSTYTAGGAVFLGVVSDTRSVGIYSVADQLYRGAQALISPVGQVMYPYMVRTRNYWVMIQTTVIATLVACLGAAFTSLFGNQVITIIFGQEFVVALPVLNIFMITIIINTPSVLLGYPMFGALRKLDLANQSVLIAGIIQVFILLGFYLLGFITPVDVAIAVMVAELAVLFLRAKWCSRLWFHQQNK